MQPLVAVSTDVRVFDNYTWHAVPQQYLEAALTGAGVFPLLVPSFGDRLDLDQLLDAVDGVMVTGSKSNVHPSLYGGDSSEANGPYDPARDATTLPLIRAAVARGIPVLAICRGFQEVNVALGGSLYQAVQEVPGHMDHRENEEDAIEVQYGARHPVRLAPGGLMERIMGSSDDIDVNSLHGQGVDRLAAGLQAEGHAPDGLLEAYSLAGGGSFLLGVQWHPEYALMNNPASVKLFAAFGEACAAYKERVS
ncbi:MAG TPA: gamma-glutamyl-gamma-aminobutyrate hydrolase family protein [Burkholderiaceae bacterium]